MRRRYRFNKVRPQTKEPALFIICAALLVLLLTFSGTTLSEKLLIFVSPSLFSADTPTENEMNYTQVTLTPQRNETQQKTDVTVPLSAHNSDVPTILIYHTHTLEAYTPTEQYPYKEKGGDWRTTDNTRNIVTVGEKLAEELRSYGFNVIHDTTNHEPPKLSTAYERSLETMKKYKKEYPGLVMFIDLHRDACGSNVTDDYCVINGEKTARVMFVVGTGKGATGTGFSEMPDFDSNYALASSITEYLRDINSGLVREIRVKTGRYNQHISDHCLLIEIGHNMNTLEEALAATPHVAKAIAAEADFR